jgi:hypothetical protein
VAGAAQRQVAGHRPSGTQRGGGAESSERPPGGKTAREPRRHEKR